MKTTSTILISLILLLSSSQLFAKGSWAQLSGFSGSARHSAVSFVLNDVAYIGTGKSETSLHNDFWSYDPTSDTWAQVASLPGPARQGAVAFCAAGQAYVGTGQNGSTYYNDFYAYDQITNTWESITSFAGSERYGSSSFTIDGKGYVGTGRDASGAVGDFYSYEPATNRWEAIAGTSARQNASAFAVNGKGYIASGVSYNGGSTTVMSDVREYDPATDSWTTRISADSKLSSKHGAAAAVFNDQAYILGGNSSNQAVIYNPADNSLSIQNIFSTVEKRINLVAFNINNELYAGLGYNSPDFFTTNYLNDLWKLEAPKAPVAPTNLRASYDFPPPPNSPRVNMSFSDNSDNEEGFLLYYSTDGGNTYQKLNSYSACNKCRVYPTHYSPQENTVHLYKAAAYNTVDTVFTEAIEVKIPIRRPYLFTTTAISDYYFGLRIGAASSHVAKNYVIERALASKGVFSPIDTVTEAVIEKEYADFTVQTGETYQYLAYAITEDGVKSSTTDTLSLTASEMSPWKPISSLFSDHRSLLFTKGDSIYSGGGNQTVKFSAIDVNTGKETPKKPVPFGGSSFSSFVENDMAYVVGGYINGSASDTLWQYNVEKDSWKVLAHYPGEAGGNMVSFAQNGKFYIGGGYKSGNFELHEFYSYSPGTGQWQALADLPAEIKSYYSTVVAFKGKGYIWSENKLFEYNPANNTWVLLKYHNDNTYYTSRLLATEEGLYILTPEQLLKFNFTSNTTELVSQKTWGSGFNIQFRHFSNGNSIYLYTWDLHDSHDYKNLWQLNLGTPVGPQNFTVIQPEDGELAINLSWRDGSNKETAYLIERRESINGFVVTLDTLAANTETYTDTTVMDDFHYTYLLTALNEMGRGGKAEAGISTPYLPLTGVTDLEAKVDSSFVISLSWNDNNNPERNYRIRRFDQNTTTYLDTLTANSTSFQEKFMYEGRELQYTIESVGSRGSKYQTVKVTTPLFKPEQVWFDSSAIPTAAININWQNNSELPHLIVIERSTNKQTFEEIGRVYSPETSYSDKSAEAGIVYQYRLYAVHTYKEFRSDYSEVVKGISWPITGVADLKAEVDSNFTVSLSWNDNSNSEVNYVVKRFDQITNTSSAPDTLPANSSSFQELYVFEGRELQYEIISVGSQSTHTQTVKTITPLFKPEQVWFDSLAIPTGVIVIKWFNPSQLADKIIVERSSASHDNFVEIARVAASETAFTDKTAKAGTVYHYRLYAYNSKGNRSYYSTTVSGISNKPTGFDEKLERILKVYPNPATTFVKISGTALNQPIETVSLWSSSGALIRSWHTKNQQSTQVHLEIGNLPKGLYYLQINTAESSALKKLLINE